MGQTVFVLGAGASVHARAPVMREFLDQAALVGSRLSSEEDAEAFERVMRARSELQLVHSKAKFDLRNLESVFAAFEMAELFGRLGSLAREDVQRLTKSMRRVIVRTLELTMLFRVFQGSIQPSNRYHEFARSLFEIQATGEHISVITFNYDIALDHALGVHFETVDYGFDPDPIIGKCSIELLKLHGSLNWGICSRQSCGRIGYLDVANFVDEIESPAGRAQLDGKEVAALEMSRRLMAAEHLNCRATYQADPVVVPPTTNKLGYHRQVEPVWRRAAARLAEAESIWVIGYSWPLSDQFFHQLFAIGSVGQHLLKRFAVVNPDPAVRDRFKSDLLGQQAIDRFDDDTRHQAVFTLEAINRIRSVYDVGPLDYIRPRTRKNQ